MQKLLTIVLLLFSLQLAASDYTDAVTEIERSWAKTYYSADKGQQHYQYSQLLHRITQMNSAYPDHAELLIWQAITLATRAEQESSFNALSSIHHAKDLLIKAISINPQSHGRIGFCNTG
jgi:hypothetical protein